MATKACCVEVSRLGKRKLNEEHHPLHEDKKSKRQGVDLISQLPDDVLVAIISLLSIKEAGRSSILSNRWRYLWTFYSGKIEILYGRRIWRGEYVQSSRLSKILESHCGSVVDELVIHFRGHSESSADIDSWVDFASQKSVRKFELDFMPHFPRWGSSVEHYKFSGIYRILSSGGGFSSLTCLRLTYVNVSGEVLEHFLATCSFLKQLVVRGSYSLQFLKVSGEGLMLESLELYGCRQLETLNINADNLISLAYDGEPEPLVLAHAPRLSKLIIGDTISSSLNDMSCMISSFMQQLECLTIELPHKPPCLPKLYRLKDLTLHTGWTCGETLLSYTSLIKACPLLCRFSMHYLIEKGISVEVGYPDFRHESLKVVELDRFQGYHTDLELASNLLKIAISLEKLIINIDPSFPDDTQEDLREQLSFMLPSSVKLVMLKTK